MKPWELASIPKEYIESTLKFIPVFRSLGYIKDDLKGKKHF